MCPVISSLLVASTLVLGAAGTPGAALVEPAPVGTSSTGERDGRGKTPDCLVCWT